MNGQLDMLVIIFDQVNIRRCFRRSMIANRFFTMIVYFTFAILHIIVCILLGTNQTIENRFLGGYLEKHNGALSSIRHFFIIGELQTYEKSSSIMPKIWYLTIR